VLLLAVLGLVGCDASSLPTQSVALASLASVSADDLAEARDLRRTFGLRADEDWIRLVGADPAAKANKVLLGIPLTDEEREELEARATNSDQIADLVER